MNNASSSIIDAFHVGSARWRIRDGAAAVILAMLCLAAATVVFRRLAGALVDPLPPALMLAAVATIAAAAAAVRLGWLPAGSRGGWLPMAATSLAALSLFVSLCLPGTPPAWIAVFGILLAAEETWAWASRIKYVKNSRSLTDSGEEAADSSTFPELSDPGYCLPSVAALDAAPAENVTQQLVRSRAAGGGETISGWLRAHFAAGQRTGSVHLAFCPPLDSTPKVEIEQIGGPAARIKTAQVLPYGVRLDVKLATSYDESTEILMRLSAIST